MQSNVAPAFDWTLLGHLTLVTSALGEDSCFLIPLSTFDVSTVPRDDDDDDEVAVEPEPLDDELPQAVRASAAAAAVTAPANILVRALPTARCKQRPSSGSSSDRGECG